MDAIDLRFATGHTLSHALRILLEGDTLAALSPCRQGQSVETEDEASDRKPFARYAFMDSTSRDREFAAVLQDAARRIETRGALQPDRRRIDPHQFVKQLIELRKRLDKHGVPYDFFANNALEYAALRTTAHTPHLGEVSHADALDHVVRQWNDPALRSGYPLELSRWDRRFQHKGKAGSPEHQAMYEVIQQRVADVAATGGDPAEALRPHVGRFLPLAEAVARFGAILVQASQQPPSVAPAGDSAVAATSSAAVSGQRGRRRSPASKQDMLEWAREKCPGELARMARKELSRRSPGGKPPPRPREKSAQQQAEACQREQELTRARAIADPDARRTAVDGWVRTWITPDHLQAEPTAAVTAWAGYEHLSPVERTELFNQTYIDVYRELHGRYIDAAAGPRKQPVKAQLAANGLQVLRCLWKARALADALGLPYDMFLRAIMERKLVNGKWTHAGRPNQLFDDLDLACARGLPASSEIPEVVPSATGRPSCFGYPVTGKHVPCATCSAQTDCETHVARVRGHLQATTGTDDPQSKREREKANARAKKYRANKKAQRQAL